MTAQKSVTAKKEAEREAVREALKTDKREAIIKILHDAGLL